MQILVHVKNSLFKEGIVIHWHGLSQLYTPWMEFVFLQILVHVKNSLFKEGIVIHWHGLSQLYTPWMDGAAYVSQVDIFKDSPWQIGR